MNCIHCSQPIVELSQGEWFHDVEGYTRTCPQTFAEPTN